MGGGRVRTSSPVHVDPMHAHGLWVGWGCLIPFKPLIIADSSFYLRIYLFIFCLFNVHVRDSQL